MEIMPTFCRHALTWCNERTFLWRSNTNVPLVQYQWRLMIYHLHESMLHAFVQISCHVFIIPKEKKNQNSDRKSICLYHTQTTVPCCPIPKNRLCLVICYTWSMIFVAIILHTPIGHFLIHEWISDSKYQTPETLFSSFWNPSYLHTNFRCWSS